MRHKKDMLKVIGQFIYHDPPIITRVDSDSGCGVIIGEEINEFRKIDSFFRKAFLVWMNELSKKTKDFFLEFKEFKKDVHFEYVWDNLDVDYEEEQKKKEKMFNYNPNFENITFDDLPKFKENEDGDEEEKFFKIYKNVESYSLDSNHTWLWHGERDRRRFIEKMGRSIRVNDETVEDCPCTNGITGFELLAKKTLSFFQYYSDYCRHKYDIFSNWCCYYEDCLADRSQFFIILFFTNDRRFSHCKDIYEHRKK
jgi:hypothetical protein